MALAKSYNEARKLYDLSVDLAGNWISRYYPNKNYKFFNIPLEKIQAFSQHHFFSCLLEEKPIEDIWTQYPRTVNNYNQEKSLPTKIISILISIARQFSFGQTKINHLKNCDVVILASGRHLYQLLETIDYIKRYYKVLVVGKIKDDSQIILKKRKIPYLNVENPKKFTGLFDRLRLLLLFTIKPWGAKKNHRLLRGELWKSRLWYLRIVQFPEIVALINLAMNIFNLARPKVLFTVTSNDTFGAAFALAAQENRIPVCEIQHGLASWEVIESEFYQSDYYLVWGKVPKKLHPKNAVIVGCPFLESSKDESNIFNKNFESSKLTHVLVLWTPPFGALTLFKARSNSDVLNDLIKGLSRLGKNYLITIRSHPSYSIEKDLENFKVFKNIKLDKNEDVIDSIVKSDVVITGETTAGLIAILLKKSLLFFDNSFLMKKFGEPFTNSGSAVNIPLARISETDKYIKTLLQDEQLLKKQKNAQQKFVDDYIKYFGRESNKLICKFLRKLINENRT